MREVERINKSVLTVDSIDAKGGWSLAQRENPVLCFYCKSPLFYVEMVWGIVEEEPIFEKEKRYYSLREIGLNMHCAECGHFHDDYYKYFYPKDKLVCCWDDEELNYAEIEEIKYCLEQFNEKGNFTSRFNSKEMRYLKEKLKEYEIQNYSQRQKKRKNRNSINKKRNS